MKTRRNLRRTLRGGDPAVIGIVLGSVLAVGIGAMMYRHMRTRKTPRITDKDIKELSEVDHSEHRSPSEHRSRKDSSDDEDFYKSIDMHG